MACYTGQVITKEFTLRRADTSQQSNADSLPVGKLVINGVDQGTTVTVTNISTGVYKAAATLPTLTTLDQMVELRISATVNSISDNAIIWWDTGNAVPATAGYPIIDTSSFSPAALAGLGLNYLAITGTGTLNAVNCIDTYIYNQIYNGLPAFKASSIGTFFYWYSPGDLAWCLSTVLGTKGSNYFISANNQMDSALTGHGTTTGPPIVSIGGRVSVRSQNYVIQTGTIAGAIPGFENGVFFLDTPLPNALVNQIEGCMFRITSGAGYPLAAFIATYAPPSISYDGIHAQVEIEPYAVGAIPAIGDTYSIEYDYLPICDIYGRVTFENTEINSVNNLVPLVPDYVTLIVAGPAPIIAHTTNSITINLVPQGPGVFLVAGPGCTVIISDVTGVVCNPVISSVANRNTQTPTITFTTNLPGTIVDDGSCTVIATWAGNSASTSPTVSQIVAGIMQDTTSGNYIVAGSFGKGLFTGGAVPGSASGIAIVGSAMALGTGVISEASFTVPAVTAGAPSGILQSILHLVRKLITGKSVKDSVAKTITNYNTNGTMILTVQPYTTNTATDTNDSVGPGV